MIFVLIHRLMILFIFMSSGNFNLYLKVDTISIRIIKEGKSSVKI